MSENLIDQKTYDKLLEILDKGPIEIARKRGKNTKFFELAHAGKTVQRGILCAAINDLYDAINIKDEIVIDGVTYIRKPPNDTKEAE